ncbi:HELICc domain containing protein [uncultured Caudovirales phage]|uniref:HELICc domain containing protein n=1 Tax=uncultured Caudovirales phage TaxID=2100421 RepID=A0A6J5SIZ6_9CAUD|nr:HELICc domain containing protein [uncultured Caudovirales phage]CAB5229472.1 HELICc domain containing protein [uncultured Caudovirales phage]
MQLFPHQQEAKLFLLSRRRAILADQPRVGKTLPTAAAALENLPALIVCPAIAKTVWEAAFSKLAPKTSVHVVNGKREASEVNSADVTIINYDVLQYGITNVDRYNTLVLDECHRIKNPKAQRTKAAMLAMKKIECVYALSGTPIPNRPIELWPILHGLGIYRGGWFDFAVRYAKMWNAPWGLDTSGASNLVELKETMKPHVLRRKKEDIFKDYRDPQVSLITFDLPNDKREQSFDADALVANPNALLAFEGLAEIMREAGMKKVKAASEFIDDLLQANEPVVVFAHHKDVVAELEKLLMVHKPVIVVGDTARAKRDKAIADFQSGQTKCIIGNIAAMSEGVDLSAADTIVFVECTWSTSALEQASSRVENINKSGIPPVIYILTIKASLDHTVLAKVLKKLNIVNQII